MPESTELLLDRIPTVPDLLGLLFGLFLGARFRGHSLVLTVSEQVEVLRTLETSPLRLAPLRTIGRMARVDQENPNRIHRDYHSGEIVRMLASSPPNRRPVDGVFMQSAGREERNHELPSCVQKLRRGVCLLIGRN